MDSPAGRMHNPAPMPEHPSSGGALRLAIDAGELAAALALLRRLFDIRITYFDLDGIEADGFDVKPISAYCRARRRDPAFDAGCRACDRRHLELAKRARTVQVYRCHDGLVEGVLPLYDHGGSYLGSIMFGQMRPGGGRTARLTPAHARLRASLPRADPRLLRDVASLLKWLTEHLVGQAVVRGRQRPWAEQADAWIRANLARRITIAGLARHLGRSASFVSHAFRREFGMPLHRHVLSLRISEAKTRLAAGARLADIAAGLGFCDAYHFSRTFRAMVGVSPSRVRASGAPAR